MTKERDRARVALDILKTAAGRDALRAAGHRPGGYVLAAHWDDRVGDVLERILEATSPNVTVVVYGRDVQALLGFAPGHNPSDAEHQCVDPGTTIGMLAEAMAMEGSGALWSISITPWKSAVATNSSPVAV